MWFKHKTLSISRLRFFPAFEFGALYSKELNPADPGAPSLAAVLPGSPRKDPRQTGALLLGCDNFCLALLARAQAMRLWPSARAPVGGGRCRDYLPTSGATRGVRRHAGRPAAEDAGEPSSAPVPPGLTPNLFF